MISKADVVYFLPEGGGEISGKGFEMEVGRFVLEEPFPAKRVLFSISLNDDEEEEEEIRGCIEDELYARSPHEVGDLQFK